jgi:predicted phosphodiesterase
VKILYASDLHLEFPQNSFPPPPSPEEYDVVVLAGDVALGAGGVTWALSQFGELGKPIIYVPGNHEYYSHDYDLNNAAMRSCEQLNDNLHVMLPGVLVHHDVRFVCATLWSDLVDLKAKPEHQFYRRMAVVRGIADFHVIKRYSGRRWMAQDCMDEYDKHLAFIRSQLSAPFAGKTVVITHFMPTYQAVAKKYENSDLNGYFANALDEDMERWKPEAWIFGHTHSKQLLTHPSGTKLCCNPWGYPKENEERKWEILEL